MPSWTKITRTKDNYIIEVENEFDVVTIKKKRDLTFWEKVVDPWQVKYEVIFSGHITQLTFLANTASNLLSLTEDK